jgi:hypothetical protein
MIRTVLQKGVDPWLKFIERDLARVEEAKSRCAQCKRPLVEGQPFTQARGEMFCSQQCAW